MAIGSKTFSNNELGLTLTFFYGMVKHMKMLVHKILWKVMKIFAQECSMGDLGFTLMYFMARSTLLSRLLYGRS